MTESRSCLTKTNPLPVEPPTRLTRAEWDLLQICWKHGCPTIPYILNESKLYRHQVCFKTVQVLLNRLVKKGWLHIDRRFRYNQYIPLIDPKETILHATRCFYAEVIAENPEHLDLVIRCLEGFRENSESPEVG